MVRFRLIFFLLFATEPEEITVVTIGCYNVNVLALDFREWELRESRRFPAKSAGTGHADMLGEDTLHIGQLIVKLLQLHCDARVEDENCSGILHLESSNSRVAG